MSRQKLEHLRKQLEGKLKDLSVAPVKKTDLIIVPSNDPVEHVQSQMSMDLAVRALNDDWQVGKEIRSALGRIDAGEYGICEACAQPIAPKRLQAIPWVTLCRSCQSSLEAAEKSTPRLQDVA